MKRKLKPAKSNQIISLLILNLIFFIGCQKSDDSAAVTSNTKSNTAPQSSDRGQQIVAAYLKADAAPYRKSRLRFTVSSETDPTIVYEIDVWRKQTENETLTLTHIIKPVEDNELSSLADEAGDKDTIITTYVSSTGQFRETGSNKALFGGVPAQELLGEWSKYNYRYIGEKDLNGTKVSEVEGILNPAKRAAAARMTALFRTDNNLPAELHLFDPAGKELRTFHIKSYQTVAGRNYVSGMEIENSVYKTRIAVDVLSMSFPESMDDSLFTRDQLKKNAGK